MGLCWQGIPFLLEIQAQSSQLNQGAAFCCVNWRVFYSGCDFVARFIALFSRVLKCTSQVALPGDIYLQGFVCNLAFLVIDILEYRIRYQESRIATLETSKEWRDLLTYFGLT
jgi:hypothetical protein